MSRRALAVLALAALAGACGPVAAAPPEPRGWMRLGKGRHDDVSGCALERHAAARTDFLVVHDSKKPDLPRLGRVTVAADATTYAPLAWPAGAEWPVDLESICGLPGRPGRFVALASGGRLFTLDVDGDKVALVGAPIEFPKTKELDAPNYEGFAVREIDGKLVAAWADRGDKEAAGRLFWGPFDAAKGPTVAGSVEIRVPWPEAAKTRDVTDLKIDAAGVVWATAAWDDDEKTPLRSALYALGVLRDASPSGFRANAALVRARIFLDQKVEALELVPGADGGFALGSDDEGSGGWFLFGGS